MVTLPVYFSGSEHLAVFRHVLIFYRFCVLAGSYGIVYLGGQIFAELPQMSFGISL